MQKIKFRTANDGVRYNKPSSFDEVVPEYQWSDELERPVIVGKVNLQEQIQQYADCALDKLIAKYMPEEELPKYLGDLARTVQFVDDDGIINDEAPDYNDLKVLSDIYDKAEDYREQFGLSDDLSVGEIYKILGEHAGKMGETLKKKLAQFENKDKESEKNETVQTDSQT